MKACTKTALSIIILLSVSSFGYPQAQPDQTISNRDMSLVDFQDLAYPPVARTAHVQGVVVVRLKLDGQGNAEGATAISGPETLIADCLANAKKWRFRPNAQKAAVVIYNFRLTDGISKSGCSHFTLQAPNFATITGCVPEVQ
ncbi:MAG: energy transducer TonB [Terriglobales bacterium]